jgi:hypothetical protein
MLPSISPLCDFDFISLKRFNSDKVYRDFFVSQSQNKLAFMNGDGCSVEECINSIGEMKRHFVIITNDLQKAREEIISPFKETLCGVTNGQTPEQAIDNLKNVGFMPCFPYTICNSPKVLTPTLTTFTRPLFIKNIKDYRDATGILLLGIRNTEELYWYRDFNTNMYLVTGLPVLCGMLGKEITDTVDIDMEHSTYEQMVAIEKIDLNKAWPNIVANIAYLRKLMS